MGDLLNHLICTNGYSAIVIVELFTVVLLMLRYWSEILCVSMVDVNPIFVLYEIYGHP